MPESISVSVLFALFGMMWMNSSGCEPGTSRKRGKVGKLVVRVHAGECARAPERGSVSGREREGEGECCRRARDGCAVATCLGLQLRLVRQPLKPDLVQRVGRVAAGRERGGREREGEGRVCQTGGGDSREGASAAPVAARDVCGCAARIRAAPARRARRRAWRGGAAEGGSGRGAGGRRHFLERSGARSPPRPPQAACCGAGPARSPDELAQEDLLRAEGRAGERRAWRRGARPRGASRGRQAAPPARLVAVESVDDERQQLVDLSLRGRGSE